MRGARVLGDRMKRVIYGFGAIGGTVAVVATVLDNLPSIKEYSLFSLNAESNLESFENPSFPKWDWNWDHRLKRYNNIPADDNNNEVNIENRKPTATRHIILIRHGQYNLDGKTDAERSLTELGRKQATQTGKRLADLALPFSVIVHSNMTRAIETADLISKELPNIPMLPADSLLREGPPIRPEPSGSKKDPKYEYTEGARIEAAFRQYFHRAHPIQDRDSYEIVVCHANVIRYFWCRALQFPPEAWLRLSLRHGSLTWITIRPDGQVHSRALGDAGHMPTDLLTST